MSFGPVISDTQSDIAEQNEDPAITVRREMLDKMEAQLDKFHDVQKQLTGLWDTVDKLRVSTEEMIDSLTKI
jgi:oligoribonuclease (3'-5' exoribonuclease)